MEEPEMQLKGKKVTDKFTESVYVLANEPSVALYRLQEHVRRSLPELAQHKADMQRWEEQSQGAIYTVEYACSAVKNLVDSSVYFRSVEGLLKQAINIRDHMNASAQGHRLRVCPNPHTPAQPAPRGLRLHPYQAACSVPAPRSHPCPPRPDPERDGDPGLPAQGPCCQLPRDVPWGIAE
ncbi:BLOC-1-related complex subunit 8 isoform X1 [Heterocephalus glaber]|uniref:BLOC-1-related complex subunit 8 isoform X1 n=1 Tax=Heterocephalus glaber TaxID=10181 RepID=A0AAX6SDK7_HETGA|nr:BLOC-1-related complex subunit 8 isoform X1 [Heterocephalus glaber]